MTLTRKLLSCFVKLQLNRHRNASQMLRIVETIDLSLREEIGEQWIKENLDLPQKVVFVDVGARGSIHPIAKRFADHLSITLLEPEVEAAEVLRQETSDSAFTTVLEIAAGEDARSETLYVTRKPGGSSTRRFGGTMSILIQRNHPDLSRFDIVATQQIPTRPLKDLFPAIDILKIDTQGTSFEVLSGLGNIRPILIELEAEYGEIYSGQKSIHEVGRLLSQLGYFMVENRIASEPLLPFAPEYGLTVKISGNVIFVPDLSNDGRRIIGGRESQFQFACAAYGLSQYSDWLLKNIETLV